MTNVAQSVGKFDLRVQRPSCSVILNAAVSKHHLLLQINLCYVECDVTP